MVINDITKEFQIIYEILERIETAITFSKINTFHNSIVNPNELFSQLLSISKIIKTIRLLFEPEIKNLIHFERAIEIKSYSKENKIVFIIEIPLVEKEKYDYFHLYPLPIQRNNTFKIFIPMSKYLIMNEKNFAFLDQPCKEINSNERNSLLLMPRRHQFNRNQQRRQPL